MRDTRMPRPVGEVVWFFDRQRIKFAAQDDYRAWPETVNRRQAMTSKL